MPNRLLEAIGGLGTILGTPGAVVTTAIGSQDPMRALRSILNTDERMYGADLLGGGDDWGTQIGGLGVDMLADLGLGVGALGGLRGGKGLLKAIRSSGRTAADLIADESGTLHIPDWFRASSGEPQEFYSRLREAIAGGPKKYASSGQRPAYDQLMGYLKNRASPQEVEWTLGDEFADAGTITQQSLMDAIERRGINLDVVKRGGPTTIGKTGWGVRATNGSGGSLFTVGSEGEPIIFPTREQAITSGRRWLSEWHDPSGFRIQVKPMSEIIPSYGPLEYPNTLLPGGRDATETLLRMLGPDSIERELMKKYPWLTDAYGRRVSAQSWRLAGDAQTLADMGMSTSDAQRFMMERMRQNEGMFRGPHWGPDDTNVVGWNVADTREMAGGGKMRLLQEVQSDWGQEIDKMGGARGPGYQREVDSVNNQISSLEKDWNVIHEEMFRAPVNQRDAYLSRMHDLEKAMEALRESREQLFNLPPAMPFARNNAAAALAMKKAIYDAAKEGSDAFAIMPGELVQAIEGGVPRGQIINYNSVLPNEMKAIMKPFGVKQLEMMQVPGAAFEGYSPDRIAGMLGMKLTDAVPPSAVFYPSGEYLSSTIAGQARAVAKARGAPGFRIPPELRDMIIRRGFPILSALPAAYAGSRLLNAIQA